MINVHLSSGIYFELDMKYEVLMEMLEDNYINPDTYIRIRFPDGTKGAFRKCDVVAVDSGCEYQEQ